MVTNFLSKQKRDVGFLRHPAASFLYALKFARKKAGTGRLRIMHMHIIIPKRVTIMLVRLLSVTGVPVSFSMGIA